MTTIVDLAEEVADALRTGRPVVALETTLVAHGFPAPIGLETGLEAEREVRSSGAVPATVAVLDGRLRVGLDASELERLDSSARKVGPRDLAACIAQGAVGATTTGGTLVAASAAHIRFVATGGIGGVHRGFPELPDVSADLAALARLPVAVVCSGVKSLLDVAATIEVLETLGVPVLGFGTETLPLFYTAVGGPRAPVRVDEAEEVARIAQAHWALGGSGLLVGNPPPESLEIEDMIVEATRAAEERGVRGPQITPFVLSRIHERSGGRSLTVNRRLVVANAGLAARVAGAYAAIGAV